MIELVSVTKSFGKQMIISDASYKSPSTGIVCLIGPSGIGKSTLVNIISSFDSDYSGYVLINNENIKQINTDDYRKNNIGFIFQNFNLVPGYTSIENILLTCETTPENVAYANELLSMLNINDKANEKIDHLSGGEKQRVAIARALIKRPSIIIADEPTGSLDKSNTQEIMNIIKDISKQTLVFLITHDEDNEHYADQLITIEDEKIVILKENETDSVELENQRSNNYFSTKKIVHITRSNIKNNIKSYLTIATAICIGLVALLFSFSFKSVIKQEIVKFQNKNTSLNNGYILYEPENDPTDYLIKNDMIKNVYYQYVYDDVTLAYEDKVISIEHKYPTAKANQTMSYGVMPREDKNEIALSPSLAKKYSTNINELINQQIIVSVNNNQLTLTVSGIFNASYDDFIISSTVEQSINSDLYLDPFSITYDVTDFDQIVNISEEIKELGYKQIDAAFEVEAFLSTFQSIQSIFILISFIILAISIFMTIILLQKLNEAKTKFIGLLKANGYSKKNIKQLVIFENCTLAAVSTLFSIILIALALLLTSILSINFIVNTAEIAITVVSTFVIVISLSSIMTIKTINTDPAELLKEV